MARFEVVPRGLNVRSGPGTRYAILEELANGALVDEIPVAGWRFVRLKDGKTGWVSGAYLREAAEAPVTPAAAVEFAGPVLMQSELLSRFGTPRDPAPYLKIIDLREFAPYLWSVKDYNDNAWSCRIYGHELMEAPLRAAFKRLCERGLAGELLTFDGCVNIRPPSGGGMTYSVHAWGLAVDFNARTNGYGKRPALSSGFVKCFAECGFEWGGLWDTPDGMHFQLPWIRVRTDGNPLNPVAWRAA
jgi:hypothetical protein